MSEELKKRIDYLEKHNVDIDNLLRESFKIPKCNLGLRCDECPFEVCQMLGERRDEP